MNPKLNVGDIIEVHGFIMLKGMNAGDKFRVAKINYQYSGPVYWFTRPRGKKIIVAHYTTDVDMSIDNYSHNHIQILQRAN